MVSIEDLRRQIRSQVKFSVPFSPLERISRFGDERRQDNGKIGTSSHHLLFRDRVWQKVTGRRFSTRSSRNERHRQLPSTRSNLRRSNKKEFGGRARRSSHGPVKALNRSRNSGTCQMFQ